MAPGRAAAARASIAATPEWIGRLLRSPAAGLLARLALTMPFWLSGLGKLADWNGALAEAAAFGLQPTALVAAATILVQLGGSALIILRRWSWLGAGALGIFTAIATLIAHPFWTFAEDQRFAQTNIFFEHVAIIGGLFLAAALDARRNG